MGGGGNPTPAPQVSRPVIATAHIDITDDETLQIKNDEEGGDHAEISLVISNSST